MKKKTLISKIKQFPKTFHVNFNNLVWHCYNDIPIKEYYTEMEDMLSPKKKKNLIH